MHRSSALRRAVVNGVAGVVVVATALCGSAATTAPVYVRDAGGFRSVLAYGEGQTVNALDLARYEALGTVPPSFVDQAGLYDDGITDGTSLSDRSLGAVFKPSAFVPENAPGTMTESPAAGVVIARDPTYQVPRIYGTSRTAAMFGAGYATAEDRLFLMDVLRRTAEGTLAGLLGASAVPGDSAALAANDLSPAELTHEVDALPTAAGAEGARALADLRAYVAGINAYIEATRTDPTKLPAEYPALGTTPAPWTLADTAAEAYLLIGQFTVSGGGETQQAVILRMLRARLGTAAGNRVYADLRFRENPQTPVTTRTRFPSDDPRGSEASAALLDPGSVRARDAVVSEQPAAPALPPTGASAPAPAWVRELATGGLRLPHEESNAILVSAAHSRSGHPLAVMGPQVGYYSPEILLEYELHAPGIQVSGMSFPGASPYPLIGHGLDFAWTGTTAMGDNQDTFAELLCNPDGSRPSERSTHYVYRGRCIAFRSREQTETTPVAPTSPAAPEKVTLRTLASVHGPVFAFATVHGRPVALTAATAVYRHAVRSVIAFMRLAEDRVDTPRTFLAAMHTFTGNENWFYIDSRHIAWLQSGWFPRRAAGTDIDLPVWGTGRYDWRGFTPSSYGFERLPDSANPTAIDPAQGYLVSWNNKAAPGWEAPAGTWVFGPVQRVSLLEQPLRAALARGRLTLADVARVNLEGATRDLHGAEVLPYLLRALGPVPRDLAPVVRALQAWQRSGAHRRDTTGSGYDDRSAAVLTMDAWWPRLVSGIFEPTLGPALLNEIGVDELAPLDAAPTYTGYYNGWDGQVQAALRRALGERVPGTGAYSYCGGGVLARCRAVLLRSLRSAVAALTRRYGSDLSRWRKPVFCPNAPGSCDEIDPVVAGAVATPAQPWQNRGTFQQAVEILAAVPRSRLTG